MKFGEPSQIPTRRLDDGPLGPGVPSYSIFPADIVIPADQIKYSQIKISDFGEAFFPNSQPKTLHTPMLLLPPENFFQEKLGPPADVWTLACTLYEILGERPLFEAFIPNKDDTIAEMISTLGILPSRWWKQWEKRPKYFLEDGSWNPEFEGIMSPITRPLNERLWGMGRGRIPDQCEFSFDEMRSLEKLLEAMLRYEPSERITASEAMRSGYMTRWGQLDINVT